MRRFYGVLLLMIAWPSAPAAAAVWTAAPAAAVSTAAPAAASTAAPAAVSTAAPAQSTLPSTQPAEAPLPPGARDAYFQSEGLSLHYVVAGKGPLVVLLHGFGDFWYTWNRLMPALAAGHTVVALDGRGYNLSAKPADPGAYAMPHLVADIDHLIDALGARDAVVVGHDWGAYIAWRYAQIHPERTRGVVSLNIPHPLGYARELRQSAAQQAASRYVDDFLAAGAETKLSLEQIVVSPTEAEKPYFRTAMARSFLPGMLAYYRQNFPRGGEPAPADARGASQRLAVPALIIHGLKDTAVLADGLNDNWRFSDAELAIETLPEAGHSPHWDAPDRVERIILPWLSRVDGGPKPRSLPDVARRLGLVRVEVSELLPRLPRGYAVRAASMRRPGQTDLVASGEDVAWYEAPSWTRHAITGPDVRNIIDIDVGDVDGDGLPDVVVASGFLQEGGSKLAWYRNPGAGGEVWRAYPIGQENVLHRARFVTIARQRYLATALLFPGESTVPTALAPMLMPNFALGNDWNAYDFYKRGAALHLYRIPGAAGVEKPWPFTAIDDSLPFIHGFEVGPWDGVKAALFTASAAGVHVFTPTLRGGAIAWEKAPVGAGNREHAPFTGSGEARSVKTAAGYAVAALEPWHGPDVAIYEREAGGTWRRRLIDSQPDRAGHGLIAADLSGTGRDDVIACFFGPGRGLVIYRQAADGAWSHTAVDSGGVDCQGLAIQPLADGVRILAAGEETHNVRAYDFLRLPRAHASPKPLRPSTNGLQ